MVIKRLWKQWVLPALAGGVLAGALCGAAQAETYFGAAVGGSFGGTFEDVRSNGINPGVLNVTSTDLDQDSAVAFGFRLGHYFSFLPWLGVEFQWYTRSPDVDAEPATLSGTITTPTVPFQFVGASRVTVKIDNQDTYGFMVNLRTPEEYVQQMGGNIEPYIGVGLAVNSIDIERVTISNAAGTVTGTSAADSDVDTGFLGQVGINYRLTERLDAFVEYKYTSATYSLVKMAPTLDTRVDASDHTAVVGFKFTFLD